jgi:hypothetical protein
MLTESVTAVFFTLNKPLLHLGMRNRALHGHAGVRLSSTTTISSRHHDATLL